MKKLSTADVREAYLQFFESKGHARVPSASLVPENDPTTLFTSSGMQPMLPYLLGQPHPLGKRLTDSQKSFRSVDIEEVGDKRHTTFFEMLGNWSFGDYFKEEQLTWMWEFLTKELGLDPRRVYVTAFRGNADLKIPRDDESAKIWQRLFAEAGIDATIVDDADARGLQGGRIFFYDEAKNWWSRSGGPVAMPLGEPGGPDSELFWDFGLERGLHEASPYKDKPCHVNCDCGRFMEIGNNVFMEYLKTSEGFTPLPQRNVDFGGGLERIEAALIDDPDVFHIDVFVPLISGLEERSGHTYGSSPEHARAMGVIADHVRAAVFLIGDGVEPATRDQGYFVRRLLRRAIRFGQTLGIGADFLPLISEKVIDTYASAYPNLIEKRAHIIEVVGREESKFRRTLTAGLKRFHVVVADAEQTGVVSADSAFELYQSYGFPLEMTVELAGESGVKVDEAGFQEAFKAHQDSSRTAAAGKFRGGLSDHSAQSVKYHTATHLLHQALRDVLGTHVVQRGSNITPERLRFDFSHTSQLTLSERQAVEDAVNQQIQADVPVIHEELTVSEAKAKGALGLFEHKYGERVSVYSIGDYSVEICGGPHVEHTGELGRFVITKEESAGAGVRRIRAEFK